MSDIKNIESELNHIQPNKEFLENQIKKNKTFRKELDEVLQRLKNSSPSRERSLSITKLQEAIMWLGMDLKRINKTSPYTESYNPDNVIIHPTEGDLEM